MDTHEDRQRLWRHPDFARFWSARTISWLGSHISFLAIPLTAVLLLEATPLQMGLLTAAEMLPYLLLGLYIGAWVDRLKRRPLLVIADVGRGLLTFAIPLLAAFGGLSIEILIAIAFLGGILTVVADVAEEAYLPALVGRDRLAEGYAKLSATSSATEMIGPGIAGLLVQWLSAQLAVAFDAASFLISGVLLMRIQTRESAPIRTDESAGILREIKTGLSFSVHHKVLRAIIATSVTLQLFGGMVDALLMLYVTRDLALPPVFTGMIYVFGSMSGLAAAGVAERLIARFGIGLITIVSAALIGVGWLIIPMVGGLFTAPIIVIPIFVGMLFTGAGNTLFNVTSRTLTQTLTPDHLLGRVNSSSLFLGMGVLPIGSLAGGALATLIGTQAALMIAGIGLLFGWLWVLFSPLRSMSVSLSPN